MKAVVFKSVGSVKLCDVPKPDLQTDRDALIKVTATAICGTDLHILSGKIPVEENTVLGHEVVGVVEKTGSGVKRVNAGDRVVVSCTVQCGECVNCRNRQVALCKQGGIFGLGKLKGGFPGGQAEYIRVPYADTVLEPIPDNVSDEQAIFVGDILSTGYMALENGYVRPGDVIAIFGAGPVGLCVVAAARLFGASRIISIDLLNYRLDAAKHLGADIEINSSERVPAAEIKKITDGQGADVVIEAVGSFVTFQNCIESVKAGGNISIVGGFPPGMDEISIREIWIQSPQIRMGLVNMIHMDRLMSLIKYGKLDLTPLITHRMPLDEAEEAYCLVNSRSANVLKAILYP
jgi:alcohol dehydrogenase